MAELLKGHHNSITTPEHGDQNSCSLEHLSHKRFFCHICVLVELSFCSLPYLSPPNAPNFQICYVYAVVKKSTIPYKCRNHGSVSQLSLHYQMTKNCLQSKTVHVVWPVPILNCTISKKNHAHTSQQFDDCHIFPTPFTPSGIIKRGSPVLCLVLQ